VAIPNYETIQTLRLPRRASINNYDALLAMTVVCYGQWGVTFDTANNLW